MSILNKYNTNVNPFTFEQSKEVEYKNLEQLYKEGNTKIPIYSFFINTKGRFGDSAVAMTDGININLPNHLTETVKEMMKDPDIIDLANDKGLGIEIYEYHSNRWGTNYSVNFIEMEIPF